MANIEAKYMGLKLKSPVIVGSSGLSLKKENIIEMEKSGAGAIVLKSLFEEQIRFEYIKQMQGNTDYPDADAYIRQYTMQNAMDNYLELISNAKKTVSIPIIASVNCYSDSEWQNFTDKFEKAGADALEINIFHLPSDENIDAKEIEEKYYRIVDNILQKISIPVSIKIGSYFTDLARFVIQLSHKKIGGLVLFNRAYSPNIDIEKQSIIYSNVFSNESDVSLPIRWTALLSGKTKCDICATTGIHSGEDVVKLLLVGANAVQVTSLLYKKGINEISKLNDFLCNWMDKNNYKSIDDFRGKMSFKAKENAAAFERVQFMKYYSGIE
ncbi:MAG: dihydroorotate dehydrogenase-like protein [Bacteroidales bacterium]|nr:dihydroorotate dehydrogenase-like protein [Bacteroidales bacterium]